MSMAQTYQKVNKAEKLAYISMNISIIILLYKYTGPGKSTALLSTFRNGFSTFRCYVSMLTEGGEGAEAAESGKLF